MNHDIYRIWAIACAVSLIINLCANIRMCALPEKDRTEARWWINAVIFGISAFILLSYLMPAHPAIP